MPGTLDPSARHRTAGGTMLTLLTAALLATACQAPPPDDLVTVAPWPPFAGLPTTMAATRGADATFQPPPAPEARSGGEQVARSAAALLVYPIVGGLGLGAAGGPAGILAAPVGAALGLSAGLAEGARALSQDVHTPQELEASVATVRRLLDPTRLGDCLRETLVARSAGRLVSAPPGTSGPSLRVRVDRVVLIPQRDSPIIGGGNPPMALSLSVRAELADSATAAANATANGGGWLWNAEPRRYFAATAEQGQILQSDIGLAVGILAQRMLADIYPGSVTPPPTRRGPDAERFRASCPDLAPAPAAGQTASVGTAAAAR